MPQTLILVNLASFHLDVVYNLWYFKLNDLKYQRFMPSKAEFKEFVPRLKYGWFHLKWYSTFQDLSRHPIETGF